jgi:CubicO group peptidase (beta-lactamase class C family)
MKKKYLNLLGLAMLCTLLLPSCTFVRIGAFFMPSVTDHKIFPVDTIAASSKVIPAFVVAEKYGLPELKTWVPKVLLGDANNIEEFLAATETTSLLVMQNDTLIFEGYANGHKKENLQTIFSVTKGIMAMLAAIAVEDGIMRLDQKVSDFIPEFAQDDRRDIEIHHLLNMVSGIDFSDRVNFAKLSMLYYGTNQDKLVRNYNKVSHRPGTFFAYKSIATQILAMCLEAASQKKLYVYLQEKIWEPLGMEYDALYTVDSKKNRNNRAFGGIAMCSRDMLRIGKLLQNKGLWEGKQILPASFVETLMYRDMSDERWWGYSNCFWRDGYINADFLVDTDFFASGFHGQYIYVNPENNIVMVRQGKKETLRWPMLFGRLAGVLTGTGNEILDACRNYEDQFEGVYESSNGEKYEIIYNGVGSTGEKQWVIWKDVNQTLKTRKLFLATVFDGRSVGVRRFSYITRAIFDIKDNKIVGMYYDNQRAVDMRYFVKKGEMSLGTRKEVLAGMGKVKEKSIKVSK